MDPQEPPTAAPEMPGEVQGQGLYRLRFPTRSAGRKDLDAPNLMVHQSGTAAQRRAAFFCPPLAPFIPADRFRTYQIGPPRPHQAPGFTVRGAIDIHGFAEHTHGRLPDRTVN
jgi:hypothetical protein